MRRYRTFPLLLTLGGLLAALFPVQAQAAPALIAVYPKIAALLSSVQAEQVAQPSTSLADLNAARNLFREVAPQLASSVLVGALQRDFDAATQAIALTPTDLQAQLGQIRAILRKGIYDQLIAAVQQGKNAAPLVNTLAATAGLGPAVRSQLLAAAHSGNSAALERAVEEAILGRMARQVRAAESASRSAAFLDLARASNGYLLIEDAAVTAPLSPALFSKALDDLAKLKPPASAPALLKRIGADLVSVRSRIASAPPSAVAPGSGLVALSRTAPFTPSRLTPTRSAAAVSRPRPPRDPMVRQLTALGLPRAQARSLGAAFLAHGQASLPVALDFLDAQVARAIVLAQASHIAAAQTVLGNLQLEFSNLWAPWAGRLHPVHTGHVESLLRQFSAAPGLRVADLTLLLSRLAAWRSALTHRPLLSNDPAWVATLDRIWSGWPRLLVTLIAALLIFWPLRLLGLAFGGRNRSWQLIRLAMVFLLLPLALDGLAMLGNLLAALTGLGAFNLLAEFSLFENPLIQILWALLMLAAVLLAAAGFRGICLQLGLLRASGAAEQQPATPAHPEDKPENSTTTVEWDEEF